MNGLPLMPAHTKALMWPYYCYYYKGPKKALQWPYNYYYYKGPTPANFTDSPSISPWEILNSTKTTKR